MAAKEDKKGIELDKDKRLEVIFHELDQILRLERSARLTLDFGLHDILIYEEKEENVWRRKMVEEKEEEENIWRKKISFLRRSTETENEIFVEGKYV